MRLVRRRRRGSYPPPPALRCRRFGWQLLPPLRRLWYSAGMPTYYWDEAKDELLRQTRGISFEDVVYQLEHGGLLDTIDHPNQVRYPGQRIYLVRIGNYAYQVPFDETAYGILLRTAYPSRKTVRDYLQPNGGHNG